jgi:hypothetical protein
MGCSLMHQDRDQVLRGAETESFDQFRPEFFWTVGERALTCSESSDPILFDQFARALTNARAVMRRSKTPSVTGRNLTRKQKFAFLGI